MRFPEQELQISVVEYLSYALPNDVIVFHVPNGGKRNPMEARRLKRMGVLAGVSDLCILFDGRCGFIEIKAGKGKETDNQIDFMRRCKKIGIPTAVARSLDEVIDVLKSWGIDVKQ